MCGVFAYVSLFPTRDTAQMLLHAATSTVSAITGAKRAMLVDAMARSRKRCGA